jgi:hypothetical protein
MAAAANNLPEEVDGNQEILSVQNLDYSGLHYAINVQSYSRGIEHSFQPSYLEGWGGGYFMRYIYLQILDCPTEDTINTFSVLHNLCVINSLFIYYFSAFSCNNCRAVICSTVPLLSSTVCLGVTG